MSGFETPPPSTGGAGSSPKMPARQGCESPRPVHKASPTNPVPQEWEEATLPKWLVDVPLRLRQKLIWSNSKDTLIPDKAIVLLFVGKADGDALDQLIAKRNPGVSDRLFALDWKRCNRTQDYLRQEPYFSLCTAAAGGRLEHVGGGPMCRTFTVKRLIQQDNCKGMVCRGNMATGLANHYTVSHKSSSMGGISYSF